MNAKISMMKKREGELSLKEIIKKVEVVEKKKGVIPTSCRWEPGEKIESRIGLRLFLGRSTTSKVTKITYKLLIKLQENLRKKSCFSQRFCMIH
jgi:hypothetical protein